MILKGGMGDCENISWWLDIMQLLAAYVCRLHSTIKLMPFLGWVGSVAKLR